MVGEVGGVGKVGGVGEVGGVGLNWRLLAIY